ncbi:MAG: bifunctional pyr operon transcriptional regulator/uracil phosphoribosyltransferase PyrR [Candidatus Omnitrophota bacterium]|nr:MAG: bifunctional pyr operon transcriptional regulator/uracil phosphoribosyltransferase PyrR [Candidatus Omnitrophota bacterium]
MTFKEKARILDAEGIKRAVTRISHEILEKNKGTEDLVIIGIRNRGEHLGHRVADFIEKIIGKKVPFGILDITLYRDDLTEVAEQPILKETRIDFDITGKKIVLVDDVLFTGRTIRCAMDQLIDFGRPTVIQLAVLVDRGHRELPIRADYVGKNVPTALNEVIEVKLKEYDGVDEVVICEKSGGKEQGLPQRG